MSAKQHIVERYMQAENDNPNPAEAPPGTMWYIEAHHVVLGIAADTGLTCPVVAGVVSALSPRQKWERNVLDARRVCEWATDGNPGSNVPNVSTRANRNKAAAIARTSHRTIAPILPMLGQGRKTRAFARLLANPHLPLAVVVDTHAARIALGGLAPSEYSAVSAADYDRSELGYLRAADYLGIQPARVQAVTWTHYRNEHYPTTESED